jgi:hypothetical protein
VPKEKSVPEHLPRGTDEHEPYDELCALAAGGLVEGAELVDFRTHMKDCNKCRAEYQELSDLVTRELPQAQGKFRQRLTVMRAQPLAYSRQRFLRRARTEGVVFSPEVDSSAPSRPWYLRPVTILAPIAALVVVVGSLTVYHFRETPETARATDSAAAQQIAELKQENSVLAASLSRLNESVAAGQREIQNLRAHLGTENPRRNNEKAAEAERSSGKDAQLLDESRNQEKLLADAKDEAARINQLHLNDEVSLVEQQTRITELSDKLRIASATLDQERQLAAAGKDVRELMAARQLHVIDVRDADSNGKPGNAFGRVFLTEGKSLTFYAFDLNENSAENAKRSFQVWAVLDKGKDSARSLGLLRVDAKAQGRWVLKVDNPELVKEINAVFITANPAAGGTEPRGQKMLYAYLGEANHP